MNIKAAPLLNKIGSWLILTCAVIILIPEAPWHLLMPAWLLGLVMVSLFSPLPSVSKLIIFTFLMPTALVFAAPLPQDLFTPFIRLILTVVIWILITALILTFVL